MSDEYLFTYTYDNGKGGQGIGSVIVKQDPIVPITSEVLKDACEIVKEQLNLAESSTVIPLSFRRLEEVIP